MKLVLPNGQDNWLSWRVSSKSWVFLNTLYVQYLATLPLPWTTLRQDYWLSWRVSSKSWAVCLSSIKLLSILYVCSMYSIWLNSGCHGRLSVGQSTVLCTLHTNFALPSRSTFCKEYVLVSTYCTAHSKGDI